MTVFANRLTLLLRQFNISNAKLAKAINVDPSLVSKWINGKRVPASNSMYILQIAEYFLKNLHDAYEQPLLLELLSAEFPQINLQVYAVRRQALIDWLRGEEDSLRTHIKSLERSATNGSQSQFPVETGSYELYKAREGRRQAVIDFLQAVLASPERVELLLMSQEDIRWITEDQDFLNQWISLLHQVIKSGHRIKIVHTVNRDISQIAAMLNYWIPMHLTGQVESFYHHKYEDLALFKTVFIASGIKAILSLSTFKQNDSDYTLQFTDPAVLGLLEDYFKTYLSQCQPLIKVFSGDDMQQVFAQMIVAQSKPGHFYTLRNHLTSLTMPTALFARLLKQSRMDEKQKEAHIKLHREWKEVFLQSLNYHKFREICPVTAIDVNLNDPVCIYPGSEFFLLGSLHVKASDLKEHLEHIIDLLENYDNYELILFNTQTPLLHGQFSLTYKEDYYAMVSSNHDESYIIKTIEGNTLHAFENYFDNIYQQIPINNRSKSWVINKLKSRLKLSGGRGC